jgi:hypothetical protein
MFIYRAWSVKPRIHGSDPETVAQEVKLPNEAVRLLKKQALPFFIVTQGRCPGHSTPRKADGQNALQFDGGSLIIET